MNEGVSCLMMTQPKKQEYVVDAIRCFYEQTYPERELVIGCHGDSGDYFDFLESEVQKYNVPGTTVTILEIKSETSLGDGRNHLMECARYDILYEILPGPLEKKVGECVKLFSEFFRK